MCYRIITKLQRLFIALAVGILASTAANAADNADKNSASTIDLGFNDEFKMFPDELGNSDKNAKPQLSIEKKDTKPGLISPPSGIVPKTGAVPGGIVPKTGAIPGGIVPKTGVVPGGIVPKTGAQPGAIIPKTGALPGGIVPKTGVVPGGIVPKTGAQPGAIIPKTGALPGGIVPKTGVIPGGIVPKTGEPSFSGTSEGTLSPQGNLLPPEQDTPIIPQQASIIGEIDDAVFAQMSDIEKQTAVLSLELRREKLKNEIDAIKAQRLKATDELNAAEESRRLKKLEWEKEQERKIIAEQIKLKKADIAFEKLRQEGLLKAYKEQMLVEQQKWIDNNASIYERIKQNKKEQEELIANMKDRLTRLVTSMDQANKKAEHNVESHKRQVTELQTQISILKARLEAEQKTNPFADGQKTDAEKGEEVVEESRLSDLYVIMEVVGQGEGLVAKLMNRDGQTFMARIGTVLQTGQKVDEIDTTHIRVDKNGIKDYLYFSAGGILEKEPGNGAAKAIEKQALDQAKAQQASGVSSRSVVSSRGIPGVSRDMMLR